MIAPSTTSGEARVAVLAPSPILTVTVEHEDAEPELHLQPGGQGFWVARMIRALEVTVAFCAPLGGKIGTVLRALIESEQLDLIAVETSGWNGAYVHDRHRAGLVDVARIGSPRLMRHETDALYAAMVSASLEADLAVLTGSGEDEAFDPDFYRRLASDLRGNGGRVLADLSGPPLAAALAGGIEVLHVSERELREHTRAPLEGPAEIATAMERLREQGADYPIVSRGPETALVLLDDGVKEVVGPVFDAREPRGAGDSMFGAIAASLARGQPIERALQLGVAAGALNAVRRGLGSGNKDDIERLAPKVKLRPLDRG